MATEKPKPDTTTRRFTRDQLTALTRQRESQEDDAREWRRLRAHRDELKKR
jgi:hypothetical protein